jgi:hypothetical protein
MQTSKFTARYIKDGKVHVVDFILPPLTMKEHQKYEKMRLEILKWYKNTARKL